jgi:hypothetical protein
MAPGELEHRLLDRLAVLDQDSAARRVGPRGPRRRSGIQRHRPRALGALLTVVAASALAATAVVAYSDAGGLDVQVATRAGYAVDTTTAGAIVEYIGDQNTSFGSSGTGTFGTFVQIQDNPSEEGYNTDGVREFDTGSSPTFNHSVKLSAIPTVPCESLDGSATAAGLCWELFADINDSNANDPAAAHIQLTDVEVWFTGDKNITGYDQGGTGFGADADLEYDYSGNIQINDVNQGSGRGDLRYLIPLDGIDIPDNCGFGSSTCATYFVLYTEWGDTNDGTYRSDSGFEEWKVKTYPTVTVTKTADTSFTRTFAWTIDKSVTPDSWDLFRGDTGTSEYTVAVTKDDGTDSDFAVSGTITIANPSTKLDAVINSASDITDALSDGTPVDIDCGSISFPYTISHGDSLVCTYSAAPTDASADENTASVTLAEGTVFTGTADVVWGEPTTKVNDTINVDDTYAGDLGSFSDDGSTTYERKFSCDADEGTHNNTATIVETKQSDSASVDVNCYALGVSKDAATSFKRTYEWTIDKSSTDPADLTLNPGESYTYHYDVTVDVTGSTDSAFAATGNIHVHNPAPIDAVINSVSDVISGFGAADVDCGTATFPYTLGAGLTLDCTYSADLPDDASRTNTATATLQNYDYDKTGAGTASGTTNFTGTASVDFSGATMDEVDECIDVTDTFAGALGTVCVADAPKTFHYTRTIQPTEQDCAGLIIDNTASFKTNDTGATGDDDWTVIVTVPCQQGCTLTQGYWKTHSVYGPAKKSDPTWDLLPGGLGPDTVFFLSGKTWYQVFWTPPKGNPYYILAHQYEAAKLNILSGASSTTAVDNAIAWAENFFSTYTPTNWPKGLKNQIVQNAGVLGSYNEGLTGPGHCDEDASASAANLSASSGTR